VLSPFLIRRGREARGRGALIVEPIAVKASRADFDARPLARFTHPTIDSVSRPTPWHGLLPIPTVSSLSKLSGFRSTSFVRFGFSHLAGSETWDTPADVRLCGRRGGTFCLIATPARDIHPPKPESRVKPDYAVAFDDIFDGLRAREIWRRLGWQEVRRRYRRTVFGPFWTTLSLGIFIGAISVVWAPLFNANLRTYLPYLTAGMVSWSFVSSIVIEGCSSFTSGENLIKQLNFPYSTLAFMVVWRNTIVLFHHLVILFIIYLVLPENLSFAILLFLPGLFILALNGVWLVILLGMISARFRDVPPLIGNLMQVMLFITPIFWSPDQLGGRGRILVNLNYLYHLIDLLRSPLLGARPAALSYIITILGGIIGWLITFMIYARFRRRIAFWL